MKVETRLKDVLPHNPSSLKDRMTKEEVQRLYNISPPLFRKWVKDYGLPVIEISKQKLYVRLDDLIRWEDERMFCKK